MKSTRRFSIFFLIAALALSAAGRGQVRFTPQGLPVSVYNVEQGLSQSTVNQVFQDHRGLIWVATGDGLQYFDGTDFRSFRVPSGRSFPQTGKQVNAIGEITPGRMIFSTRSALLELNDRTGDLSLRLYRVNSYPWISGRTVAGSVLGWTAADGFFRIGEKLLRRIHLAFSPGQALPDGFVPSPGVSGGSGHHCIAGRTGCLVLNLPDDVNDTVAGARWIEDGRPMDGIASTPDGTVFLLSRGTLYRSDDRGQFNAEFATGVTKSGYLFIDRTRNFWVSDYTRKQLFRIRGGTMEEIFFIVREGSRSDTLRPAVRHIFEDRRGNLWFGTDGHGLLLHSPGQISFDLALTGFTRCFASFGGHLWAGTFRNGLWKMNEDLSIAQRFNPKVFPDNVSFFDLAADSSGRLWVATDRGIEVLGRDGAVLFRKRFVTSTATFISLSDGRLLVSTYDRLYQCETGRVPGVTPVRDQTHLARFLQAFGSYWMGSQFGLHRTDTALGMLRAMNFSRNACLGTVPVNCLLSLDGMMWAGTERGLACYGPDGREQSLPAALHALDHEVVCALAADEQNRIWFSGNRGIGMISPGRDRILRFGLSHNLQSVEFNNNACLTLPGGRIYFGGIRGINRIDTRRLSLIRPSPGIGLIALTVSDTLFCRGIPAEEMQMVIHRRQPHLGGSVFTPCYLTGSGAQYAFFLEGYQSRWSPPSTENTFSFRNLPPGRYALWARCSDEFGNAGPARRLLRVVIHPPFWKTGWFMALALLSVIAITIVVLSRIQGTRYRNRLKDLERRHAIDRERLRISQDMHDEVGASLTQISILSELVKKKKDDPAGMLHLIDRIAGISGTVVDDMSEIIWAMNPRNDTLESFTSYLRRHVSTYLSDAGLHAAIDFPEELPDLPMTSEQRRNLFLVVKEALHNAVRHAGAGRVGVRMVLANGRVEFTVDDDGKGFDPVHTDRKGNGLANMRRRVEELGGVFRLTSAPGRGTRVEVAVSLAGA